MNLPHYAVQADPTFHRYQFTSIGPKGSIIKIIQFSKLVDNPLVYNLALGDFDSVTGTMNDDVISDNQDRDKILATVGFAVIDFCSRIPDAIILAEGNNPVKKRLYQMQISSRLSEIQKSFHVYGIAETGKDIEFFEKNKTYAAILVKPI
jgi:hypothetical protein